MYKMLWRFHDEEDTKLAADTPDGPSFGKWNTIVEASLVLSIGLAGDALVVGSFLAFKHSDSCHSSHGLALDLKVI